MKAWKVLLNNVWIIIFFHKGKFAVPVKITSVNKYRTSIVMQIPACVGKKAATLMATWR